MSLETWPRYWQKGRVNRRQNSLHVYPALNCNYNQILDIHLFVYMYFHTHTVFHRYLAKFRSITNIIERTFLELSFREPTAAVNFPCSKSWLKIRVNDVIFSKIPHGMTSTAIRMRNKKTLALILGQFSTPIVLIFSTHAVVFMRKWHHFLKFSTKTWNQET